MHGLEVPVYVTGSDVADDLENQYHEMVTRCLANDWYIGALDVQWFMRTIG